MNTEWIEFNDATFEADQSNPRVLLNAKRIFRLNDKALDLLGKPKAIRFLYDAGQQRIGIRAETPEKAHAFKIVPAKTGNTAIVRGSPFCKRFGIKPEFTISFQGVRIEGDGTLVLDLATAKRRAS